MPELRAGHLLAGEPQHALGDVHAQDTVIGFGQNLCGGHPGAAPEVEHRRTGGGQGADLFDKRGLEGVVAVLAWYFSAS